MSSEETEKNDELIVEQEQITLPPISELTKNASPADSKKEDDTEEIGNSIHEILEVMTQKKEMAPEWKEGEINSALTFMRHVYLLRNTDRETHKKTISLLSRFNSGEFTAMQIVQELAAVFKHREEISECFCEFIKENTEGKIKEALEKYCKKIFGAAAKEEEDSESCTTAETLKGDVEDEMFNRHLRDTVKLFDLCRSFFPEKQAWTRKVCRHYKQKCILENRHRKKPF